MIDDDGFTIDLQKLLLEQYHTAEYVFFERSGKSGLNKLRDLKQQNRFPDYILVDINMPDMNGFEFLDKFEESFRGDVRNAKVIVITASLSDSDRRSALEYSFVYDYLIKPLPNDYIANLAHSL